MFFRYRYIPAAKPLYWIVPRKIGTGDYSMWFSGNIFSTICRQKNTFYFIYIHYWPSSFPEYETLHIEFTIWLYMYYKSFSFLWICEHENKNVYTCYILNPKHGYHINELTLHVRWNLIGYYNFFKRKHWTQWLFFCTIYETLLNTILDITLLTAFPG